MSELAVAQCSYFVKHHEWIPAMYFLAMFEWCSIFILMNLEGYLLIIADRCHICFACHFQTVHPIPVIFISISTVITTPFQWHSWISKLSPGSIIPFQIMHMHRIPHPTYHAMFMCWLFTILCASFWCCFFGLVPITSRLWGPVRLRPFVFFMDSFFSLAGSQARWPYPRNHFYLCLLDARSFAMPMMRYLPHALSCLPHCHVKPLTHLVLANRCLAMLPLCSAPFIALLVTGEDWSLFLVEHGYFVWISQYLLFN